MMSQPSDPDDFEDDDTFIHPVGTFRYLNIADTPCYRDTFLYSIIAALSVGLTQFMMTSNVKRSTNTAVITLSASSLLYYSFCRHKLATEKFKFQQIQHNLQEYVAKKGTLQHEEEED